MKCSTKTEALKISGLKTGGKRIKKHGIVKNGKKKKQNFSLKTRPAFTVEIHLKFPITKLTTPMENPNIIILPMQSPLATFAITGVTKDGISVPSAEKLEQSERVKSAMFALGVAIRQECEQTELKRKYLVTVLRGAGMIKRTQPRK